MEADPVTGGLRLRKSRVSDGILLSFRNKLIDLEEAKEALIKFAGDEIKEGIREMGIEISDGALSCLVKIGLAYATRFEPPLDLLKDLKTNSGGLVSWAMRESIARSCSHGYFIYPAFLFDFSFYGCGKKEVG